MQEALTSRSSWTWSAWQIFRRVTGRVVCKRRWLAGAHEHKVSDRYLYTGCVQGALTSLGSVIWRVWHIKAFQLQCQACGKWLHQSFVCNRLYCNALLVPSPHTLKLLFVIGSFDVSYLDVSYQPFQTHNTCGSSKAQLHCTAGSFTYKQKCTNGCTCTLARSHTHKQTYAHAHTHAHIRTHTRHSADIKTDTAQACGWMTTNAVGIKKWSAGL